MTLQLLSQALLSSTGTHSIQKADKVVLASLYCGLVLYIVDKNIIHRLTANTTITGEKIWVITSLTPNFFISSLFFNLSFSGPNQTKTKIGDIATTTHKYPTLITSNTAKIAIGINKINAKSVFIRNQNKFHITV